MGRRGADLSSGAAVSLTRGPPGPSRPSWRRGSRWNARARRLSGRRPSLAARTAGSAADPRRPASAPSARAGTAAARRAGRRLGAAPDAADLGLGVGAVDPPSARWVSVRRPGVWPADPERPLARARRCRGALALRPRPTPRAARVMGAHVWQLLRDRGSRRARVVLALAVGAGGRRLVRPSGSSRGDPSARAAARTAESTPGSTVVATPAHLPRAPRVRPTSRGGRARVLLAPPRPRPRPAASAPAPVPVTHVAVTPPRGWVAGLFVEQ
jgi:hypothetical protein